MSFPLVALLAGLSTFAAANPTTKSAAKTIAANKPKFTACYDKARATSRELHGRLRIHMTIDERGRVIAARQNDDTRFRYNIAAPKLRDCVITELKKLKFAPAPAGKTVSLDYPFVFSAP